MTDSIDIKLFKDESGNYDIGIDEDGDLAAENGFDTAILLSLFMEQRADPSEVSVPELRRGWIGNIMNEDPDDEWGSKIWLYYQSRVRDEELEAIIGFATDCFEWMVEDKHMKSVTFDGTLVTYGVTLSGVFRIAPDEIETRNFNLWEFTGNGNSIS